MTPFSIVSMKTIEASLARLSSGKRGLESPVSSDGAKSSAIGDTFLPANQFRPSFLA